MVTNDPIEERDVEAALRHLAPATSQLDVSSVFYRAGYQAATAEQSSTPRSSVYPALIGAMLAAVIIAPLSYRAGTVQREFVANPTPAVETVVVADVPKPDIAVVKPEKELPGKDLDKDETAFQIRLTKLLTGNWFASDRRSTSRQATTLTASYASSLKSADIDQNWPHLSFDMQDRYQTFATAASAPTTTKPLAVSDTVELTQILGDQ